MPVNIHGRQYKTVAERVAEAHKKHKDNIEIQTELVSWESGVVIMKAIVIIHSKDNTLTYTDYAYEKEGSSTINKTSILENCSTSAIGRALSAAGFAGSEYASADEVAGAIKNQNRNFNMEATPKESTTPKNGSTPASAEQTKKIGELITSHVISEDERNKTTAWLEKSPTKKGASGQIDKLVELIADRKEALELTRKEAETGAV